MQESPIKQTNTKPNFFKRFAQAFISLPSNLKKKVTKTYSDKKDISKVSKSTRPNILKRAFISVGKGLSSAKNWVFSSSKTASVESKAVAKDKVSRPNILKRAFISVGKGLSSAKNWVFAIPSKVKQKLKPTAEVGSSTSSPKKRPNILKRAFISVGKGLSSAKNWVFAIPSKVKQKLKTGKPTKMSKSSSSLLDTDNLGYSKTAGIDITTDTPEADKVVENDLNRKPSVQNRCL